VLRNEFGELPAVPVSLWFGGSWFPRGKLYPLQCLGPDPSRLWAYAYLSAMPCSLLAHSALIIHPFIVWLITSFFMLDRSPASAASPAVIEETLSLLTWVFPSSAYGPTEFFPRTLTAKAISTLGLLVFIRALPLPSFGELRRCPPSCPDLSDDASLRFLGILTTTREPRSLFLYLDPFSVGGLRFVSFPFLRPTPFSPGPFYPIPFYPSSPALHLTPGAEEPFLPTNLPSDTAEFRGARPLK